MEKDLLQELCVISFRVEEMLEGISPRAYTGKQTFRTFMQIFVVSHNLSAGSYLPSSFPALKFMKARGGEEQKNSGVGCR